MKNIDETALTKARKWDRTNPAMNPVDVPYGCKAVYKYEQPVIHASFKNLPEDSLFTAFDGWGIITVWTGYVMTPQEKGRRQEDLETRGIIVIGNMRLTSQTFSRDKDAILVDDLEDMFEGE